MKTGVDLSTWQKYVNYDEAIKHINFAIIRVGYGIEYLPSKQRDTQFDNHYNGLKGKVPLGAYYYAYGTSYETGVKEAENCLAYMGDKQFEMPIYYDMEEGRNTKEAGQGFVDRIRQAGLKAGIYASTSFYKSKGLAEINCDNVWIAQYGSNSGNIPSIKPSVNYDIWQYTSNGNIPGIGEHIDTNIMENEYAPEKPVEPVKPEGKIIDIQRTLNARYNTRLIEDNIYGPATSRGLRIGLQSELNIQLGKGLAVDGIFGSKTKGACINVRKGAKGNITWLIQAMLVCKGYNISVDGDFGYDTDKAVRDFQSRNGLSADGICGKNTFEKLFR